MTPGSQTKQDAMSTIILQLVAVAAFFKYFASDNAALRTIIALNAVISASCYRTVNQRTKAR